MTGNRLVAAWGFTSCFLVGVALTTYDQVPGVDQPLAAVSAFYLDRANRIEMLVGGLLLAASTLFFLWLLSELAAGTLPLAAGALFAATTSAAGVLLALVAGELSLRGAPQPSAELERWLAELGYALLLVPGAAAAAVAVVAVTRARSAIGGVAALWLLAALPIAIVSQTLWAVVPLPLWALAAVYRPSVETT